FLHNPRSPWGNGFDDDFDDTEVLAAPSPSSSPEAATTVTVSKSKRKREAEKAKNAKRRKEATEDNDEVHLVIEGGKGVNTAIAKLDPQLIADYVGQKVKQSEKELSAVELEDSTDMTSWQKDRTLTNLPEFMETFSRYKGNGTPHILIITAAALRAADVTRALFAKHIKLKDSIEYCQKTRIGIGVGTPGRELALIKEDVLKLGDLKRIIIDASQIDEKKRGIFEIKET
ncbi:U3-containing 90S pre-ribosomal complex subunit-domain containing protein, partial [Tirmania nivea]